DSSPAGAVRPSKRPRRAAVADCTAWNLVTASEYWTSRGSASNPELAAVSSAAWAARSVLIDRTSSTYAWTAGSIGPAVVVLVVPVPSPVVVVVAPGVVVSGEAWGSSRTK